MFQAFAILDLKLTYLYWDQKIALYKIIGFSLYDHLDVHFLALTCCQPMYIQVMYYLALLYFQDWRIPF
jgi:hypothetical protein